MLEDILIAKLQALVRPGFFLGPFGSKNYPYPPVIEAELQRAEQIIGFSLPPLLMRIYLEVGNGGFGPGYGLYTLFPFPGSAHGDRENFLVPAYRERFEITPEQIEACKEMGLDGPPFFPERLLEICDHGCSIYSWLDCSQPKAPVLNSDQTADVNEFTIEASSLYAWFTSWLDDCPVK